MKLRKSTRKKIEKLLGIKKGDWKPDGWVKFRRKTNMCSDMCHFFIKLLLEDDSRALNQEISYIVRGKPGLRIKGLRSTIGSRVYCATTTVRKLIQLLQRDDLTYFEMPKMYFTCGR